MRATTVSQSGRYVAALDRERHLAVYSVENGEPRPIPQTPSDLLPVGWNADDGEVYAVTPPSNMPARIYA